MKQIDNNKLRELIDRFMDGETSNTEEQLIFSRFSKGDIPADLEEFRPMISWLGGGMKDDVIQAPIRPVISRFKRFAIIGSIAASIAIIAAVAVNFILRPVSSLTEEDYITYAGSYLIKNGVKYTNLDEILPELLEAEQLVEQQQMSADNIISSMEEIIDTSDPDVRAALESAFSD